MDAVAKIGEPAPEFVLEDLQGAMYELGDAEGSLLVINFWSMECPWATKGDDFLADMEVEWGEQALLWRVASNRDESVDDLRRVAGERGVRPVLLDSDQSVADRYGAVTTPHVYVIDRDGVLRYMGAPNDAGFKDPEPSRNYLAEALRAADRGESPEPAKTDARGCTIVRH